MALLGFQFVLTLISASLLQRITARYSIGRWLLSKKLLRCVPPSDAELKELASQSSGRPIANANAGKTRRRNAAKADTSSGVFSVPKQTDIQLNLSTITSIDVLQLPYYVEYRWLIDFSCFTFAVMFITDIYAWLFPVRASQELNLSIIWLAILAAIILKALASVTSLYFQGAANSGERSMCFCFGGVCFLLTMVQFLACDKLIDVNVLDAYNNFSAATVEFLKSQNLDIVQYRSPIVLYFFVSVMFGVLASFLTFPGIRYARMYYDSLKFSNENVFTKMLLHTSFFCPLLILLLWMKPVARNKLVLENALLTENQFESLRLWAVVVAFLLRFIVAIPNLQAYLFSVNNNINLIKRETGRISNIDIRKLVNQPFLYLCVAAIQYYAPILLLMTLACLLKIFGRYSWLALFNMEDSNPTVFEDGVTGPAAASIQSQLTSVITPVSSMFNALVHRAVWGFFFFTTCGISFFLSIVGVLYAAQVNPN